MRLIQRVRAKQDIAFSGNVYSVPGVENLSKLFVVFESFSPFRLASVRHMVLSNRREENRAARQNPAWKATSTDDVRVGDGSARAALERNFWRCRRSGNLGLVEGDDNSASPCTDCNSEEQDYS